MSLAKELHGLGQGASWPWGPGEKMWNGGAAGIMNPGINVAKARSWSLKPKNVKPQIKQVFHYERWQGTGAAYLRLYWIFCPFSAISKAWVCFIKGASTIRNYGSDKNVIELKSLSSVMQKASTEACSDLYSLCKAFLHNSTGGHSQGNTQHTTKNK